MTRAPAKPPRPCPDYSFETRWAEAGRLRIAGVDEVGRGPLAGPVVAAAVILDPARIPAGLNDSKALTARARARLAAEIADCAIVSVAEASVEEIEELNILHASHLAMRRALAGLAVAADQAIVDGNRLPPDLCCPAEAVVKGDARCVSISAASIMAKQQRDAAMVDLAQQHPGYGWERNAGYGTAEHLEALSRLGVTPHHRRSFKPIHNILYQAKSVTP